MADDVAPALAVASSDGVSNPKLKETLEVMRRLRAKKAPTAPYEINAESLYRQAEAIFAMREKLAAKDWDAAGEAVEPIDVGIRLHPRAVEHDRDVGLKQFGWVSEVHDVGRDTAVRDRERHDRQIVLEALDDRATDRQTLEGEPFFAEFVAAFDRFVGVVEEQRARREIPDETDDRTDHHQRSQRRNNLAPTSSGRSRFLRGEGVVGDGVAHESSSEVIQRRRSTGTRAAKLRPRTAKRKA